MSYERLHEKHMCILTSTCPGCPDFRGLVLYNLGKKKKNPVNPIFPLFIQHQPHTTGKRCPVAQTAAHSPATCFLSFWGLIRSFPAAFGARYGQVDRLTSLVAQMVKHLPTMWETQVRSLGQEDPLEKEMATHSSTLAWRIPWTEEPGGLQSIGSQESDTTG